MGRPSKSIEQKRKAGNPGKRPLPEPTASVERLAVVPPPPATLDETGRGTWEWVWQSAREWTGRPDALVVSMLAHATDEQVQIRKLLIDVPGDFHARTALRALNAEILQLAGRLALSPADRSRLGVAEVKAQAVSTIANLRSRVAEGKGVAPSVARSRKSAPKN